MKIIEMKGSDVNGLKNVFSVFTIDVRMFNTYNFYGGSLLQIWMAKSRRDFEEKMKWEKLWEIF